MARMRLLGAEVVPVATGSATLKDAINATFRDWVASAETHCIGSVMGPHPFPVMVRDFQRVIGVEARQQMIDATGRLPDAVLACVGGGSNAIGVFHAFIPDAGVRLIGCEAGGQRAARGDAGRRCAGVIHGMRTFCCCRMPRARHWTRTRSPPGSTIPGSGLSTPGWPRPAGRATARSPTPRRWTRSRCCAAPRESSPPSSRRTRWPARCRSAGNSTRTRCCW